MNKLLKISAHGVASLYSGLVVTLSVATGLLAVASVVTVLAGIAGAFK